MGVSAMEPASGDGESNELRTPFYRLRDRDAEGEEMEYKYEGPPYRKTITIMAIVIAVLSGLVVASLTMSVISLSVGREREIIQEISGIKEVKEMTFHVDMEEIGVAIEDDIYHLGDYLLPGTDKTVTGYAFLHYHPDYEKNKTAFLEAATSSGSMKSSGSRHKKPHKLNKYLIGKGKAHISAPAKQTGSRASTCYAFLATGSKWKASEGWAVDPTNTDGMSETFIANSMTYAHTQWNTALGSSVFGSRLSNGIVDGPDTSSPDGKNEVIFGSIAQAGVIAVTFTWGTFSGPVDSRELIEWDQVYDQVDFTWGNASTQIGVMDLQNIATHEMGHAIGLADIYTSECSEVTMYGSSSMGETKKRTLAAADISGIRALYGLSSGSGSVGNDATSVNSRSNLLTLTMVMMLFVTL